MEISKEAKKRSGEEEKRRREEEKEEISVGKHPESWHLRMFYIEPLETT